MKKIHPLLITILFGSALHICNAQLWPWAKNSGGRGSTEGQGAACDGTGNIYAAGTFNGADTITFGADTVESLYGSYYLTKCDSAGNFLWARCADGRSSGNSVATDPAGNAYVTGFFYSTSITIGNDSLNNNGAFGTYDVLLIKYDPSGNVLWAKSFGGTAIDLANMIVTDASGNVYISGSFDSDSIAFGTYTLFNNIAGNNNLFLVKLDSTGTVLWAKTAIGYFGQSWNSGLAADASGNVYVSGSFTTSTGLFDTITLLNRSNSSYGDLFLAKYDATGNLKWVNSYGGKKDDDGYGVATDPTGNVYLTGRYYSDSIYIGSTLLTNPGTQNYAAFFIAKFDSQGHVLWVKGAAGNGDEGGYTVACDKLGDVYVTSAFFAQSAAFGSLSLTPPASNYDPMFIIKFDPNGNVICGTALGSGGDDGGGLALDPYGNTYLVEDMEGTNPITIGASTFTPPPPPNYGESVYITKFICNTNLQGIAMQTGIACYGQNTGSATAYPVGGISPYSYKWSTGQTTQTITGLVAGPYVVTITDKNNSKSIDTVTLAQPAPVVITAFGDTSVCSGNPVMLSATGGAAYSWQPAAGLNDSIGSLVIATANNTTTYTVTGTFDGCSGTDTVTVTIVAGSKAGIITAPTARICDGNSDSLTVTGSSGLVRWQQGTDTMSLSVIPSADSLLYIARPMVTTYYEVITGTGSCSDTSAIFKLTVDSLPYAVISATDTIFCAGDSTRLCTTPGYISYLWNTSNSTNCILARDAGPYSVTVTGVNGCSEELQPLTINLYPVPVDSITTDKTIFCPGDSTAICSTTGFSHYEWNTGDSDACTTTSEAGGYYVTVTDANGCTAESNHLSISVYPSQPVSVIRNGDTLSSFGAAAYQWIRNNIPIDGATGDTYVIGEAGTYAVQVTDTNGCTATSNPLIVSGLSEVEEDNISIYPNPSFSRWQLTVDNSLMGAAVEVYDEQGRLVWKSEISNSRSEIQLVVSSGVYWLRISNDKVSFTRKIVKM